MIDAAFQDQVDRCLAALEESQPALRRLRRVPMDLIAEAVLSELHGFFPPFVVIAWKDQAIHRALITIAQRNASIVRAKIYVQSSEPMSV